MKNFKFSYLGFMIATVFALSLVCGCSDNDDDDSSAPPSPERVISFNTSIPAQLSDKYYPVNIDLPESVFDDATMFNKNLSIVSLAGSFQTGKEEKIKNFYTDAGFDNIKTSSDYDSSSADSISYSFAHNSLGGYDLVTVIVRGVNYGLEWSNNVTIGTEGDHQGFLASANKVYEALVSYIKDNYQASYKNKKLKLWITGYSRAGAVSNVLSYLILGDESKKLGIDQKNVFVYTFESPRGLTKEHAIEFKNVFNFLFRTDVVAYLAPDFYGLYRCGTDKVLFDAESEYEEIRKNTRTTSGNIRTTRWFVSKVDKALEKLDPEVSIPGFRIASDVHKEDVEPSFPDPKYTSEKEFIEWFFGLLKERGGDSTGGYSFQTRELFATTVQPHIALVLSIFLSDTSIIEELASYGAIKMLEWLVVDDSFYNALCPILDAKEIAYDPDKLKETCDAFFQMVDFKGTKGCLSNLLQNILPLLVGGENKDFARIINHHYSEVIYASLLEYQDS